MKEMELYPLLQLAQGYLSAHYAQALVDRSKGAELRAYIAKYLYDTGYTVAYKRVFDRPFVCGNGGVFRPDPVAEKSRY